MLDNFPTIGKQTACADNFYSDASLDLPMMGSPIFWVMFDSRERFEEESALPRIDADMPRSRTALEKMQARYVRMTQAGDLSGKFARFQFLRMTTQS